MAGLLALFGFVAADTPSLLPRPWYFQGLIGGISALIFYAVGVLIADVWRAFARWSGLEVTLRPTARRVLFIGWLVLIGLGLLLYPLINVSWHEYVTSYFGQRTPGLLYPVLSALAAVVVVGAVVDQIVVRGLLVAATQQADVVNAAKPAGLAAPTSDLRSGGPGSLVAWDTIGADGSTFVSSGTSSAQITEAVGAEAKQPIRVFAGIDNERSLEQARDLVLAELDRTRAFDRKAILVVTSTSTGFVNEWAAESFEYLLHGDTAIVTMQYSTLPSALALLTARDKPPLVGRMLFDAVAARVAARPASGRPKLYAGGESLGAYGGNGAFDSPEDMVGKVDGALWTGTPSFTSLHGQLTAGRDFGSTTIDPVIDDGKNIRFAGNPNQLTADMYGHPLGTWEFPRVVYLQHDTDPVVWWSPDLVFHTPGWLDETRLPGTPMSRMSWLPFVTFWQVTADMAMSNNVPGGYGHRYYETETVPAWAGVLGMRTDADYSHIENAISAANEG